MKTQILKIQFHPHTPPFQLGQSNVFVDPITNTRIDMEYIGQSRITGDPLFKVLTASITIKNNPTLIHNGVRTRQIDVITQLEDTNIPPVYKRNKEILVEFLFELYNIDETKLLTKEGLKEIIRDIKIINLLDE